MGAMSDAATEDIVTLLPPLLQAMDALGFIARHLYPPEFEELMSAVGAPETAVREAAQRLTSWPASLDHIRQPLADASAAVVSAFEELRAAPDQADGLRAVMRALRQGPKAQEALYPLAAGLPLVSRFFVEPSLRDDAALTARLARPTAAEVDTGVIHGGGAAGSRGAFSMYVPEYYDAATPMPLVMALHGGSGNGRAFLWSWLREARSVGAIVVAPTAIGSTWALMGDDVDTPNLLRILDDVRGRWNIDPSRLLLTGMSDGGTFCYVSGLESGSPFTHLAPAAASFHPLLAQVADAERMRGLPIHIVHGGRDWMFPTEIARRAHKALSGAGARVTYREIPELSHCYPREIDVDLLRWMDATRD